MRSDTMGKALVTAKIENLSDLHMVDRGHLTIDQVHRVEVNDALVDTGVTNLCMPKRMIQQLGLFPMRPRPSRTTAGPVMLQIYGAVHLSIQGRECTVDVTEVPDDCPVLIGQAVLGMLDFVVDPEGRRLIGNPAHGGEHMIEIY